MGKSGFGQFPVARLLIGLILKILSQPSVITLMDRLGAILLFISLSLISCSNLNLDLHTRGLVK